MPAYPRRLHCTRINLIRLMGRRSWRQKQLWPVGFSGTAPFESRPYLQALMTKCLVCGAQVIQTPTTDGPEDHPLCYPGKWPECRKSACEREAIRRWGPKRRKVKQ